jgi:hypothetical protein
MYINFIGIRHRPGTASNRGPVNGWANADPATHAATTMEIAPRARTLPESHAVISFKTMFAVTSSV